MYQTIIAQNNDPQDEFCLGIIVESIETKDRNRTVYDVVAALREAARDFVETKDGKDVLEKTKGSFNWGDLIEYLPAEVCEKHGVRIVDTFQTDLVVAHNEPIIF